jgi:hypothetical protein
VSDSPEHPSPSSSEIEALVSRAVAARVDPLQAQLTAIGRALAILADRLPRTGQVDDLTTRVEALAELVGQALAAPQPPSAEAVGDGTTSEGVALLAERVESLEAAVRAQSGVHGAQTDELRQALAVAVSHAVAKIDRARDLAGSLDPDPEPHPDQASLVAAVDEAVERAVAGAVARAERGYAEAAERILEQVGALAQEAGSRNERAEDFRQTVTTALEQAVVWIEGAVTSDSGRILDQIAAIEAARAADASRVLEQLAALEAPLTRDAIARQGQLDDLRHTVASSLDQAVSRIETARAADATQLLDRITALVARAEGDAGRRDEQAAALVTAVDERLEALHLAGTQASEEREGRLAARLEALTTEHDQVLLGRIDQRTAAIAELSAIPPMVAAEVQNATAAALAAQVGPLVGRLVEAIDNLAHEGGRVEALARSHADEARAVEDRVAAMFVEVGERTELAIDRSRARTAEGQVALGGRFEATAGELLAALHAAAERLEARLTETTEGLRAAGGHQNGALLDAVTRSSHQLGERLAEVRAALLATGTEAAARVAEADQRAEAMIDRMEALRSTVESLRHDPRLEELVVEQVASREAQLAAIDAVANRIDEMGPLVARALLSEIERAVRAANAAEEAVSSLRPDSLRAALSAATERAAEEVRAVTRRFDESLAALAAQIGQQLAELADRQHRELAAVTGGAGGTPASRLDELDRSLAEALHELGGVVAATRDELVSLTARALDRAAAAADDVARSSGAAIDDVRASQTALREAVEDGAHKAELAAIDVRGLRERLTPHLVALAEATTRRADADQAGFDAVLARLDQLLAPRSR